MKLDFKTVKALSSPTRIKILDRVLEKGKTPTMLSQELDRSKSTVAAHLDTLNRAGLLEKDAEEGRRRVVYRPTRKAEAIIEGRERKMKFSLGGSALSALAAVAVLWGSLGRSPAFSAANRQEAAIGVMDAGSGAAEAAGQGIVPDSSVLLASGVLLIVIALLAFFYGVVMRELGRHR